MSSISESHSGAPATTTMETHPSHKTALATKSLLQQVQLNMGNNSKENSDSIAEIEADEDNAFSNDQLASSDVKTAPTSGNWGDTVMTRQL